jgi:hypothetical protein
VAVTMSSEALPRGDTLLPCHVDRIAERPFDGGLVLYHPERQEIYLLNASATYVWRLCDGTRGPGLIVEALAEVYPLLRHAIEEDIPDLLHRLLAAGLLAGRSREA